MHFLPACADDFTLNAPIAAFEAAEQLGLIPPPSFVSRYNVAPTQDFPVILADPTGKAQVKTMRWGFWLKLKDAEKPKMQPNARAEPAKAERINGQEVAKQNLLVASEISQLVAGNGCPGWDRTSDQVINSHLLCH
jgi:putative SOS response-associated peptidase YedK